MVRCRLAYNVVAAACKERSKNAVSLGPCVMRLSNAAGAGWVCSVSKGPILHLSAERYLARPMQDNIELDGHGSPVRCMNDESMAADKTLAQRRASRATGCRAHQSSKAKASLVDYPPRPA